MSKEQVNCFKVVDPIDVNFGGVVKQIYDKHTEFNTIRVEVVIRGYKADSRVGDRWFTPLYVLEKTVLLNRRM